MINVEKERLIDVAWADQDGTTFNAPLYMEINNDATILAQITGTLVKLNLRINAFKATPNKTYEKMIVRISLEIKSTNDIDEVIKTLSKIKGV